MKMKILHFADIHARDKDIEEIEKCLDFIVETARTERPDLIINAGDTFDAAGIRADSLSAKLVFKIFKELADIAPVVVIIGTASHDSDTASILRYISARYLVHVINHPAQLYYSDGRITDAAGILAPVEAVLSLVPAPTKQFFKTDFDITGANSEIAVEMSKMFLGFAAQAAGYDCPHALIGHWNITGSLISETQSLIGVDIELSKEQMALSDADICLMGHIHKSQQLPGSNIFYSGSIIPLTWGELEDKGFYIHEFEDKKLIDSRFIKTPSRKLVRLSEDLTGGSDLADLAGIPLMEMLLSAGPENVQGDSVRVDLKVFQDEAAKINKKELEKAIIDSGAGSVDIRIIQIPRENIRSQNLLKMDTLAEKLIEMARLNGETVPETILQKAAMLETEKPDKIIAGSAIN